MPAKFITRYCESSVLVLGLWPLCVSTLKPDANVSSYLHSAFCRPVAHGNLKAANVLLDENLMPRVCDCSLVILRTLTISQVEKPVSHC